MATFITHINPHVDDICAIWLFKKFSPSLGDWTVEFISASRNAAKDEKGDRIYFGTGGGKFDEHQDNLSKETAASLVWEYLKKGHLVPKDQITTKALEELVEWNRLVDLGKLPRGEYEEFTVPAFIRPRDNQAESSKKAVFLGFEILDRILEVLKVKQQALTDWAEKAIEFESRFGQSYAIVSGAVDREFCRGKEAKLFIMIDPEDGKVQFFTPSFEIDLEPIYQKLKQLDAEASWFLHQSHHMILCGAGAAPDFVRTKLSQKQLMEAAK